MISRPPYLRTPIQLLGRTREVSEGLEEVVTLLGIVRIFGVYLGMDGRIITVIPVNDFKDGSVGEIEFARTVMGDMVEALKLVNALMIVSYAGLDQHKKYAGVFYNGPVDSEHGREADKKHLFVMSKRSDSALKEIYSSDKS